MENVVYLRTRCPVKVFLSNANNRIQNKIHRDYREMVNNPGNLVLMLELV